MSEEIQQRAAGFRAAFDRLMAETQKMMVGNAELLENVITCLFAGGHVLLEGVPGLGKTVLVKTLGDALDLPFSRIQFTPDLMPADITGTNVVQEDESSGRRRLVFERGPIFSNLILADEVNRATPKTQSAMLECMQEKQVTVAGTRYVMEKPFFLMATQNPIEMEGTYPLPEAQLDRFLFKLTVPFPNRADLGLILDRTTSKDVPVVRPVMNGPEILEWMKFVREILIAPHVQDYAVRLILSTHPESEFATDMVKRYVKFGASPRGAQALIMAGKIRALRGERFNVAFADIASVAMPALRHRLVPNFEAEASGVTTDAIIADLLKKVSRESLELAKA